MKIKYSVGDLVNYSYNNRSKTGEILKIVCSRDYVKYTISGPIVNYVIDQNKVKGIFRKVQK